VNGSAGDLPFQTLPSQEAQFAYPQSPYPNADHPPFSTRVFVFHRLHHQVKMRTFELASLGVAHEAKAAECRQLARHGGL